MHHPDHQHEHVPLYLVQTPGGLTVPVPLPVLRQEIGPELFDRSVQSIVLGYLQAEADRVTVLLHPSSSTPPPERPLGPDEIGLGE